MKNLNELTDRQLELKLDNAYKSDNHDLIDIIENEQKLRYMNWEKQFSPKKTINKKHVKAGNYEGIEYRQEMTFNSKGSRIRYYIDGIEVTNEKRSKAKEVIYNLKINNKLKTK
jgi:hypothetical protein